MFLLECYDVGGDSESSSAFPAKDGFSRGTHHIKVIFALGKRCFLKAFCFLKALRKLFRFVILVINGIFR